MQSAQLGPTFVCANSSFRPPCNYSKQFNTFDNDITEKLTVIYSKNVCRNIQCDWTPDCEAGMVCSYPQYEVNAICNNDTNYAKCNIS